VQQLAISKELLKCEVEQLLKLVENLGPDS